MHHSIMLNKRSLWLFESRHDSNTQFVWFFFWKWTQFRQVSFWVLKNWNDFGVFDTHWQVLCKCRCPIHIRYGCNVILTLKCPCFIETRYEFMVSFTISCIWFFWALNLASDGPMPNFKILTEELTLPLLLMISFSLKF